MQLAPTSDVLLTINIRQEKRATPWTRTDRAQHSQGRSSNFRVEIDQLLADPDFLQQKRPKGKLFQFELPPESDGMPFVNLLMGSNPMEIARGVVELRSTDPKSEKPSNRGVCCLNSPDE